jgi:hypothetical protein
MKESCEKSCFRDIFSTHAVDHPLLAHYNVPSKGTPMKNVVLIVDEMRMGR